MLESEDDPGIPPSSPHASLGSGAGVALNYHTPEELR